MCGISGFYNFDKSLPAARHIISAMTSSLRHRGPDDEQHFIKDNFALGSNRLAIIDPQKGKQPAFNESENIAAILNGEIYNCREIASWLTSKGHKLNSDSDTEILPHLYEECGEEFVTRLEGMFAIAILDTKAEKLIVARDRIGIKPLYYVNCGDSFAFASEVKALFNYPHLSREVNIRSIIDYFTLGYILTPNTAYKSVYSLPPAHILIAEKRNIQIRKYWEISCTPQEETREDNLDEMFYHQLKSSIKSHLLSDVPLGSFLSGGLDSSLVSSIMSEISGGIINTFTANLWFKNREETDAADNVATLLKSAHDRVDIEKISTEEIISIISHIDEPFADSSFIPTFLISREASKKLKVVLSGDGSDENFAGYPSYLADSLRNKIHNNSFTTLSLPLFRLALSAAQIFSNDPRVEKLYDGMKMNSFDAHIRWRTIFGNDELKELINPDYIKEESGYSPFYSMKEHFDNFNDCGELNRMLFLDIKTWLVDDILKKVDMASMANSLEVRVPFLDRRVVEFAASVPEYLKLNGREGKYIVKKTALKRLPENIVKRRKKGFNLPLDNLLRNEMKEISLELTSKENSAKHPELNAKFVNKLVKDHMSKKRNCGQKIWTVICYTIWKEKWVRA